MSVSSVANSESFQASTPSDREIVLTRLFDAPRDLVFTAMTTPKHVRRWWGILDDRYSMITCEIDLRVGGAWRWVGRGPSGEFAFRGVYHEIEAPGRLVFTEVFEPFPQEESLVTQTLTDENGKTRLTMRAMYSSLEVRDSVLKTGMTRGAGLSYDRLEALVRDLQQA
jgi:uncharacterized protein YndB with AHSA1/START domain